MCGIAGFVSKHCAFEELKNMGDTITHRGPDETGYYFQGNVGLVSKRLSIIDLKNGRQPAFNENENVIVILNGEIFNYRELRDSLEACGHRISNNSDTAVLPHLYEQYGAGMFKKLSGQFAIAIYDKSCRKLILARDRMGIIPLNYCLVNGELIFASEIKAILTSKRVKRELSPEAVIDVFTFWSPQGCRTVFKNIFSLLPGEYIEYSDNVTRHERYYKLEFGSPEFGVAEKCRNFESAAEDIESILLESVRKRLIGDVKISTYLSGGLDSSLITSITAGRYDSSVEAFSIGFEDERFDESKYQNIVCDYLGIKHNTILFKNSEIPGMIRKLVMYTETPLLRAGPAPLFRLSSLVNANGVKVVLSGEGSDELFGGYDIFREVKIRNYLKKYPGSNLRNQLYRKINTFSGIQAQTAPAGSLNYFYSVNGGDGLLDSHYARWRQYSFFERFFSDGLRRYVNKAEAGNCFNMLDIGLVPGFESWTGIQKAQYLEIDTFLSRYLLSSQGDRVSMANSVEVRYPFLDNELIDYCMGLNDNFKIKALNEKYILKKIAEKYLPSELVNRKKFPYRSPIDMKSLLKDPYTGYMLSEEGIKRFDLFDAAKVKGFIKRLTESSSLSERETMLLMGILTFQTLFEIFDVENCSCSM